LPVKNSCPPAENVNETPDYLSKETASLTKLCLDFTTENATSANAAGKD